MQTLRFALRYATRSLARGGDQTLLALLCVCFGVLAYTGTVLLSEAVDEAVLIPGPDAMGADAALLSPSGRFSPATADSTIALALAAGATAATPVASVPIGFLRAEGNGALTLVNRVMGIDPAAFPLAGPFQLRQTPHARTLSAALDSDQAAVLSRDVAGSLGLGIGDTLALAAGIGEAPTRFVIGGIAERTHDRNGSSVFLSLEGARRASGRTDLAGRVLVASPDLTALESAAAEAGLTVARASPPDGKLADIFRLLLPAAGLLGLLLGGVGVANAMQVALARRREEIAVLKSIGYRRGELVALFTTETALLGLIGSVAGVVGGYGLAALLYAAFSGALPILVQPVYSVSTPLSGLLAGVVTTAIFGAGAIVRASEVRPSALLRQSVVPLR
ncbi:MAG: FtsX-like permease family protein, partial [Bacteroidota bacterium]